MPWSVPGPSLGTYLHLLPWAYSMPEGPCVPACNVSESGLCLSSLTNQRYPPKDQPGNMNCVINFSDSAYKLRALMFSLKRDIWIFHFSLLLMALNSIKKKKTKNHDKSGEKLQKDKVLFLSAPNSTFLPTFWTGVQILHWARQII